MSKVISASSDYWRVPAAAVTALAACLLVAASGSAHATIADDSAPAVHVRYGDLNLASDQGTKVLYARIVTAARAVCRADEVDIRDLGALSSERSCERQAIEHAVSDVHSAKLAALDTARPRRG
jgi:UrcA family protein